MGVRVGAGAGLQGLVGGAHSPPLLREALGVQGRGQRASDSSDRDAQEGPLRASSKTALLEYTGKVWPWRDPSGEALTAPSPRYVWTWWYAAPT